MRRLRERRGGIVVCILLLASLLRAFAEASSLRFHGNGVNDIDRVKIRIDDPQNTDPGPPADVGATDFTIEFWMKGFLAENSAGPISCGNWNGWINGNIIIDRDRFNQGRNYGLSLGNGRMSFGVMNEFGEARTLCGTSLLLDGLWHHVAVQRRLSDGRMQLFVDGQLEAEEDGPDGNISYPDNGVPGNYCGGPCINSDPFIVFGAEKHDAGPSYPSFSGWLDEVRYSNVLRYAGSFAPFDQPFSTDAQTAALYHLDEGSGDFITDSSGAPTGPSHGERRFGGTPPGPEWSSESPFESTPVLRPEKKHKLEFDDPLACLPSRVEPEKEPCRTTKS